MNTNWLAQFPDNFRININDSINNVVNDINKNFEGLFKVIKDGVLGLLDGIGAIINIIPWWLLILIVFFLGWRTSKKIYKGIMYALSLSIIGILGLWELMNLTLAIVIASVLISLLFGLPIGILLSSSKRAFAIVRPILDAMQTMPSFVYLIPAVMFFGLGKVPAVIATIIYAIPPVIRLTCHAINQVDKEMVEAAQSFGSTRTQLLLKVKLPQALPTIMTGVNQTMMMAVSMVVTCSMIGAAGLGEEVLIGINRLEIGRGFTAGVSIVIIAILMDRLTQGCFSKKASALEE
ncbi:proline/glycine betaine ABC transporter permease [Anaerocolumna aminovalerica]|uniref:Glycine betaine/proline transport system permease protein n=1 Tax=Anaerocolumna aminovalerica TaxID=1527 RepID=A0A1I5FI57_9FIRM|nr:proline/glycine betaine ABC transporter permease [Anaerocolumna aminovalerica]MDU6264724.1 proline/glycine betaine ABC transporter permease [Anaerocolumna aminovalerica]SFO23299.1 glycine betaine/proline transport system permease protein [Anaerocolumna aminovalerica]